MRIGPQAKAKYEALKTKINVMIVEGRDPTPEEFDALMAESASLHDQIQAETT